MSSSRDEAFLAFWTGEEEVVAGPWWWGLCGVVTERTCEVGTCDDCGEYTGVL